MPFRNDDESELDEGEYPEPDKDDADSVDTVPCPYCGKAVYEEAVRCPYCENYISGKTPLRLPKWLVGGVILCLVIVLGWVLAG